MTGRALLAVITLLLAVDAGAAVPKTSGAKVGSVPMSSRTVADRSQFPQLPPPPPLVLPGASTFTLANGLRVHLVENHKAPVVDVTLVIGAGAVRDPADLPGLATFTAGMLDEGAGKRTSLEIADEIDFLGGSLSTAAGIEAAQINIHVPRRGLDTGLDLLADMALRPTFPDSEIARQRELRKANLLQLRDQPTAIAPIAFNAILFGGDHPYGRPAGGNDASTTRLDRKRIVGFYDAFYRPSNAQLLVVGDVNASDLRGLIEPRLGAWGTHAVAAPPSPTPPAPAPRAIYIVDKPDAAQSVIRIGNVGVPRSTPDYYTIQVLNTILGGSFTSRLNQNLRETHGYTYGAGSNYEMRRLAGPFRASASVMTGKTDSSFVEFLKELRRMRNEPVSAEELEKAKQFLILGLPGDFETTAGAAQRFVELVTNDLPLDTWNHYMDGIGKVTAEDVQRVARATIDDDHLVMVVVGDRQKIEPGLKGLNEGTIQYRDLWGAAARP